jgi:hypothetical protein
MGPFLRIFGSWEEAMLAAGLRAPQRRHRGTSAQARAERDAQRRAAMIELLHEAADDLDADRVSFGRYYAWRAKQLASNPGRRIDAPEAMKRAFGSWRAALRAAGLREVRWFTDDELPGALHEAMGFYGPRITKREYQVWRGIQLASKPPRRAPHAQRICVRFGWQRGREIVIDDHGTELRRDWKVGDD